MNGTAHDRHVEPPVSDLDLMLYLDGELSRDRHDEVRRALTRDKVLRGKLSALEISSAIVRERASDVAANIDFADAVMAQITSSKSDVSLDERDKAPAMLQAQETPAPGVSGIRLDKLGERTKPTNDNARGIFALAAIAVAAAAGLMIWGRMAPSPSTAPTAPVAMVTTPEVAPVMPQVEVQPAPAVETEAEVAEDQEMGVEVAAVDFGSKVGTIFYVPTEAATSKHTTTVVWLTDPDGEEK
jgi:anti-sigma factor RsiW